MRAVPPRLDSTFHYMRSYIVCGHGWKMEDCDKRLSLPLIFYLKQTFQNSDFAVICFFFFPLLLLCLENRSAKCASGYVSKILWPSKCMYIHWCRMHHFHLCTRQLWHFLLYDLLHTF